MTKHNLTQLLGGVILFACIAVSPVYLSSQPFKGHGTNRIFYIGVGPSVLYDKNGATIDSSLANHYYVYNRKKIPQSGCYIDTCLWRGDWWKLYIVSVFMNGEKVLDVSQFSETGDKHIPEIWINDKFKHK